LPLKWICVLRYWRLKMIDGFSRLKRRVLGFDVNLFLGEWLKFFYRRDNMFFTDWHVQFRDFRELSCGALQTDRYGCKKLQVWRIPCSSCLSADLTYANCRDFICTRTHYVVVMLVNGREIEGQKELRGNRETWCITNNFWQRPVQIGNSENDTKIFWSGHLITLKN